MVQSGKHIAESVFSDIESFKPEHNIHSSKRIRGHYLKGGLK